MKLISASSYARVDALRIQMARRALRSGFTELEESSSGNSMSARSQCLLHVLV